VNRRICFYAPVESPEVLDRVLFYRQDLEALRQLGYEVVVAIRWHQIRTDVDLIYVWWWTWAFVPLLARAWRRTPIVITGVFDYEWPEPGNDYVHRPGWQRFLMRIGLRCAAANVFLTRFEHDQVTHALTTAAPHVIPLSVDAERYAPASASRSTALIVSIGWLHEDNARRKGMYELVRAFARVHAVRPLTRLIIAGADGGAAESLRRLCAELGVGDVVSFPGAVDEDEKVRLLQKCAVYAQPTLFEGFGLAIAEAMSCGAPVVTCAGGAVREVVGDAGLLVPRTPAGIADGVLRLLDDPTAAARLGDLARDRVLARFTLPVKVAALDALLREVMPTSRR
jgi:glycosyltransferase involved in cell wall biosynthesis